MAPEIHANRPYNGSMIDIFACGIILFIMKSMSPPFIKATLDDKYFIYIASNKWKQFWKIHQSNKSIQN